MKSDYKKISHFFWHECCGKTLRGNFRESEYGDIILPFVLIRRLDSILENNYIKIQSLVKSNKGTDIDLSSMIKAELNINFFNSSKFTLKRLLDDPRNINDNFDFYLNSFSENIIDLLNKFKISEDIKTLKEKNILRDFLEKIYNQDLSKEKVSNEVMGLIYEELIRISSEAAPKKNGDHFTPRDVVNLLIGLIFEMEEKSLKNDSIIRSIFDPCCGSGGMLTMSKKWIFEKINPQIKLRLCGQELEDKTFALARSDFLITDLDEDEIRNGSSLSNDKFKDEKFDFVITNPPFGEDWHDDKSYILKEISKPESRFIDYPSISEGSLLFLQHLISKAHENSRIGMISNGSALLTGDAGSGESQIRKWILESDFVETIVRLPDDLFFRTDMPTYLWILSLNKNQKRKNKIQLIDAQNHFQLLKKIIGKKRKEISEDHLKDIIKNYKKFENNDISKIIDYRKFGFKKIQVDISEGKVNGKSNKKDVDKLYDFLGVEDDEKKYFEDKIKSHYPNSKLNKDYTRIGYRISFDEYFPKYQNLRSINEIKNDLNSLDEKYKKILNKIKNIKEIKKTENKTINDLNLLKKNLPDDWQFRKNYTFLQNDGEKSISGDETLLSVSEDKGIIPRKQIKDSTEHISTAETLVGYKKVKKNNLINNIMLMWKGGLGVSDHDGIVSPAYEVYKFKSYIPKFFHYLFKTELYKSEFRKKSRGIIESRLRLYDDDFKAMESPIPPIDQQKKIIEYLDNVDKTLIELMSLEKKRIELLKEYRKSLSENIVTGTIKIK